MFSRHLSVLVGACLALFFGAAAPLAQSPACGGFPASGDEVVCTCSGSERGAVWGAGPYTADSSICVAARHAGVIGASGGEVRAVRRPGMASYAGTLANGIQTSSWGSYGASFDLMPAVAACGAMPSGVVQHTCSCTGSEQGPVWGAGPYTADSSICVAARHAGALGTSGGVVVVMAMPGQERYEGSNANGVQTSGWGRYGASFHFETRGAVPAVPLACAAFPGGTGAYRCTCTGAEQGPVWGSGPYTADSHLCTAARHAGLIGASGGMITVRGVAGQSSYAGSEANGVRTSNWGAYGSSVTISLK
jgi:hypothetical protein